MDRVRAEPAHGTVATDSSQHVRRERAYNLRNTRWSYVHYLDRRVEELYEIEADPAEKRDVAAKHPELVRRFRAEVEAYWKSITRRYRDRAA